MAKKKRITKKRVQASESRPFVPPPSVEVKPEIDDGPFDDDGLSVKQRLFVAALIGPAQGNATKAARMAGYRDDNYWSLKTTAAQNLSKPIIQEAIAHSLAKKRASPEWARASLIDLAQSSMSNFVTVDDKGEAKIDFEKAAASGALGQIKEYREEGIKTGDDIAVIKRTIKIHDRTAALGMLLKLHGLLRDIGTAGADELLAPDPALACAQIPPNSIPSVVQPGKVQDDPRGTEKRKD